MKSALIIIGLTSGLVLGGVGNYRQVSVTDHGHAGTPTVPVDLNAIENSQKEALMTLKTIPKRRLDRVRDSIADPNRNDDVEKGGSSIPPSALLSTSYHSSLPRRTEGATRRTLNAKEVWRFLTPGTEIYFFSANAAPDRKRLEAMKPHVEAYCIEFSSLEDVIAIRELTGAKCLIQPLLSDSLPRKLGVKSYPALVTVNLNGSLTIREGLR
ncbi:hypothetical protein JYT83_00105 [bacterium AH-315-F18]|nr:hypothetical protein [bacterium AH-315-F18]